MSDSEHDSREIALRRMEQDVKDLRRAYEGDKLSGDKGWGVRLREVEADIQVLQEVLEEEKVERRINSGVRKAFGAGLSALGLLSGVLLYLVIRVLNAVAGGG